MDIARNKRGRKKLAAIYANFAETDIGDSFQVAKAAANISLKTEPPD
jgi:hypothetical protein